MKANLGLQPIVSGSDGASVIQVPVPVLDNEGKRELMKVISKIGEATRVSLRNHRRDAMQAFKRSTSELTEDDKRRLEKEAQKIIDESLQSVEHAISAKEREIA